MIQQPVIGKAAAGASLEGNDSAKSPAAVPAVKPDADPSPKNGDESSSSTGPVPGVALAQRVKRRWPGTRALGIGALAAVALAGALIAEIGRASCREREEIWEGAEADEE